MVFINGNCANKNDKFWLVFSSETPVNFFLKSFPSETPVSILYTFRYTSFIQLPPAPSPPTDILLDILEL